MTFVDHQVPHHALLQISFDSQPTNAAQSKCCHMGMCMGMGLAASRVSTPELCT